MKKILPILLSLFALIHLQAQDTLSVEINYSELLSLEISGEQTVHYYSFDGASNLPEFGALPLMLTAFDLPSEVFEPEVSLINIKEDTLLEKEQDLMSDKELVGENYQVIIEQLGDKVLIYLLPFRKAANQDPILRLLSANLKVSYSPREMEWAASQVTNSYAAQSVLKEGNWFKLGMTEGGVARLDYAFFQDLGVAVEDLDPAKIGIFGNYNGLLPELNYTSRVDDLQENAILRVGMEDGQFNQEDYLLFYSQAPTVNHYNVFERRYNHEKNLYADTIFYFLTTDQATGVEIEEVPFSTQEPTLQVTKFLDVVSHEKDELNLLSSGKDWFGETFSSDTAERTFTFDFPDFYSDFPAHIKIQMAARAFVYTYMELYVNGQKVIDSTLFLKVTPTSHSYAFKATKAKSFFTTGDQFEVKVKYLSEDPAAMAWLDYLEINVMRELKYHGGQMIFRDPDAASSSQVAQFDITNVSDPVRVWGITTPHFPKQIEYNYVADTLRLRMEEALQQDFIIFDSDHFVSPVKVLPVVNQDLHGIGDLRMVIVAPEMFYEQAMRVAYLHEQVDGLKSVLVTPQQIYNEFSSGSQDVTAIRDFMRMLYEKEAFGGMPGYLLLFGDASFDYKNRIPENTNVVPTYESKESLTETGSFVTDDYFGLLDEYEGGSASGELDIGIGRFPVSTQEQAWVAVEKLEHYMTDKPAVSGDWRNTLCFVADDQDSNLHFDQAEGMASIADTLHKGIRINKIYSDAFKVHENAGGYRYPDVNVNINKQIEKGAVIINYTGHGGLIGWSEEMILDVPAINGFENLNNLPLFVTATCEFSRFDDPVFTSAGEYVYLNPHGGGIALLTTTRLAYAHANIIVNTRIYQNLFKKQNGELPRLGDLVRLAKNPSNANYLNFVLLGDPALQLAFPKYDIVTNTVNEVPADAVVDTAKALSVVTVTGSVVDASGELLSSFNGVVYPTIYDKKVKYTTLGNLGSSRPDNFFLYDRILYKGKASVVNGSFSYTFMVPKDIAYAYGKGKISYYAMDTLTYEDAWGDFQNLTIGGYDTDVVVDVEGPQMTVYLNESDFVSGAEVTSKSTLYVRLYDPNGINTTGSGLGRDLVMTLDDNYSNTVLLNDYFSIDLDTYQQGLVRYSLSNLSQGEHTITVKAWDLQNNSSEQTIDFYVNDQAEITVNQVLNYPNPFSDETRFEFRHNKIGVSLEMVVVIYDLNGRVVAELSQKSNDGSSGIAPLYWDGTNASGYPVKDGIYVYRIEVTDPNGSRAIRQQKLIKASK